MGEATNFKFCTHFHTIDSNKSPLTILALYGAHCVGPAVEPLEAYRPYYSSYITTFVIGFSRSSHISDFQSLPYSSPWHPHPLFSHFSSDLCESQDQVQGRLGGRQLPSFAASWRRQWSQTK